MTARRHLPTALPWAAQRSAPHPVQAWLAHERRKSGRGLRAAALTYGVSRSVLQRAERGGSAGAGDDGGPRLHDRVAQIAGVDLGSWPAPSAAEVAVVLRWWTLHPLDRLARCLQGRVDDWQTPLRHVARRLLPCDLAVGGQSALDLLIPPQVRPPPLEWTLLDPGQDEPARLVDGRLGLLLTGSEAALEHIPGSFDRAVPITDRWGRRLSDQLGRPVAGLRVVQPRDLMASIGWTPGLAAAVRAADSADGGLDRIAGVGIPRRELALHRSMVIASDVEDDDWDDCWDDGDESDGGSATDDAAAVAVAWARLEADAKRTRRVRGGGRRPW